MITRSEITWALTPNIIKRYRLRRLINEFNSLIDLRNRAYAAGVHLPVIVDDLHIQDSDSLTRTRDSIQLQLQMLSRPEFYLNTIRENEQRERRKQEAMALEEDHILRTN